MQAGRRTTVVVLAVEIRRLDDERIAFPVSARGTDPTLDVFVQLRPAIERDDTRFVNHLVDDHHAVR